jgi:3-phosphoshikimate 1-carboxyvinyltransferase
MILSAEKSELNGKIAIPASKSHTIRAVAIASLADGISMIRNPLISSDTLSAVDCYRKLGAIIDTSTENLWKVTGTAGKITAPADKIDIGNSGTTLRVAVGSAALLGEKCIKLTGDEQIQSRPIEPLLKSLNDLGAKAVADNGDGSAPVTISGKIKGGTTTLECVTSQYLSSLLLAAPLAEGDTEINISLLNEPDYVQMTLDWLDRQNIKYENIDNMKKFKIYGNQSYKCFDETICADFSSATFFMCAGAIIGPEIEICGLDFSDSQPDKAVFDYLVAMGADAEMCDNGVIIKKSKLKGVEIDMNRTPDALPAMAVVAGFADGVTRFVNVAQARKKETDRISCMAKELGKLGVKCEELEDGLVVYGGGKLTAGAVCGHGDHRIVMALSLAGMGTYGKTTVDTAEAINITFPRYVELMRSIGANLTISE